MVGISPRAFCPLVMVKLSSPASFASPPREECVAGSGLTLPLWGLGLFLNDGHVCDSSRRWLRHL